MGADVAEGHRVQGLRRLKSRFTDGEVARFEGHIKWAEAMHDGGLSRPIALAQPVRWAEGDDAKRLKTWSGRTPRSSGCWLMPSWRRLRSGDRPGKLLSPERRRCAIHHLQRVLGDSERFACRITGQHRATQRHQPVSATPDDPDAALRDWLRAYAKDHPRRGFRPAYHDARGEGWVVNHKRFNGFGAMKGCGFRSGGTANATAPRRRQTPLTADAPTGFGRSTFQFDVTTDGRPVKIVSIIDEHTRECLGGSG